jgi:hypothetical protein
MANINFINNINIKGNVYEIKDIPKIKDTTPEIKDTISKIKDTTPEIEIWKLIPGYPGCEASNLGRIKYASGNICKAKPNSVGYISATINNMKKGVHILVALAFLLNPKINQKLITLMGFLLIIVLLT